MKFNEHYYFSESINDKNLFKVVFLAGGPGSGKSFISDLAFKGEPVVFVNQDNFTEIMFKRDGIPLAFNSQDKELSDKQQQTRNRAKELTSQKLLSQVNGMLPMVVDGTGRHYPKIEKQYQSFTNLGYDAYMIFVNTTLDVAKERNQQRERKLEDEFVEEAWHDVQDNIGKFQNLFGNENFTIVDNSKKLDKQEIKDLELKLTRQARKFINEPLKNPTGKAVIRKLQDSGKKNVSDISDTLSQNKERFAL